MRAVLTIPIAALFMSAGTVARADIFTPSKADQIKLGKRAADEVRRKERVLPSSDPRVQTVRRVAYRLLSTVSDKSAPWEFSFDVVDSKQINAFALPGGPTFIYTGLLAKMKSEDELAAVLGHEMTHTRREHWARAYADSQKRNLGLNLLLIFTRASRTVGDIANISNQVIFDLPFSRRAEEEADRDGFSMMVKASYNPQGMVEVFRTLQESAKGGKPPEILSSHPSDARRIRNIENMVNSYNGSFPAQRPLRFGRGWGR